MPDEVQRPGETASQWDERIRFALPRVYRYLCYKVGDGRLAEDLAADTFERAWRSRDGYRADRGEWGVWVLGIARHVVADFLRRREVDLAIDCVGPDPHERPTEEDGERRVDFSRVRVLLSRFPERDRELIALKYGAGLTNRAIATLTGLTETNVGTILHRVVSGMRRQWEEEQ